MRSEGAYTLNLVKIGDEETGPEYWANPILKYCSRKINDITNIIHEVLRGIGFVRSKVNH